MITYFDTSVLLKLLVDDEVGREGVERLWLESDYVACAEIGYVEARAGLASARRGRRLDDRAWRIAKAQFDTLWDQIDVVPVTTELVRAAAKLAEAEGLRGHDAVHLAAATAARAAVLATSDDRLLMAAQRHHFDVSDPR